ncbi:MAG: aromatic ring-hydroxylating dioxygenase subunit alpha [Acidimicrobiia bacterium]|nr:aromatic ring-hydroxylating dioxygenase subunit alpha [Acidimicrobiia bacterium]
MAGTTYVIDDRETPRFRVHRSAMVEPAVLDLERANIFDRCWLYVGHESEVANPHDFRTRRVGGRPVIFTRDATGSVRVFVNSCPHRGMEVESRSEGHGRFLKCFYHGWSFDTAGELVAMPDDEAYGPNFDRQNMCLPRPPHVDSYRGFVFLNWDPAAIDLGTYLGNARTILDLVADQSEHGMSVLGGTHLYSMRANWKLLVENSFDAYHAMTTHQRYIDMLKASGRDFSVRQVGPAARGVARRGPMDLGGGHAVTGSVDTSDGDVLGALGREFPDEAARAKHKARRARLVELYGEEWVNRMLGGRNHLIFPNLFVIDLVMGCTIRTFYPDAPDYMEVTAWELVPNGEDEQLRHLRMSNFLTFWGPAGLATPDDVEALERCQRGFAAYQAAPWNDLSRGMNGHPVNSEAQMRVFWRHWNKLITGEELSPEDHILFDPERDGRRVHGTAAEARP